MSDGTDWVTIKVPEEDRDRAKDYRPEGATHGDCLVAGAERLSEHLDSDTASYAQTTEQVFVPGDGDPVEEIVTGVVEQVGTEGGVDSEVLAREVAARIDYADLADRVADELEGRLR